LNAPLEKYIKSIPSQGERKSSASFWTAVHLIGTIKGLLCPNLYKRQFFDTGLYFPRLEAGQERQHDDAGSRGPRAVRQPQPSLVKRTARPLRNCPGGRARPAKSRRRKSGQLPNYDAAMIDKAESGPHVQQRMPAVRKTFIR